jgi:DeoR family transcriptional regulator, suf operon transcriptional repressor
MPKQTSETSTTDADVASTPGDATQGDTQGRVRAALLDRKAGMTIDELMASLDLSRTAVNQHLLVLERAAHVEKASLQKTGGRPSRVYRLTELGKNVFPKQYSWFSKALLQVMREQLGEERLSQQMFDLGVSLSASLIPRMVGRNRRERLIEIVQVMNETGFMARTLPDDQGDRLPLVECKNCVYHDLSKDYPEVCRFDIGFLSGLMGAEVEHQSCMQRGGEACRFKFKPPT